MHIFSDYGMGVGGMLFMGLFWIAIIAGIFFLIKSLTDKAGNSAHPESAEEILEKRYARGEISQDEFQKIKKDLQS